MFLNVVFIYSFRISIKLNITAAEIFFIILKGYSGIFEKDVYFIQKENVRVSLLNKIYEYFHFIIQKFWLVQNQELFDVIAH